MSPLGGLCTPCSLCLESSSPDTCGSDSLTSFRSHVVIRCLLLIAASPQIPCTKPEQHPLPSHCPAVPRGHGGVGGTVWGCLCLYGLGWGPGSRKDVRSHQVPVPTLAHRLAGAGGRKKIFRLSDVLKPLTDAQVEAMKLGAVKRILRAEKAVACSGAAQVCPRPPSASSQPLSPRACRTSQRRDGPPG